VTDLLGAIDLANPLVNDQATQFTWVVPDGWQQGRGSWGGLPVGVMVAAVRRAEGNAERRIRSVSLQLAAPAMVGEHHVTVTPLRVGKAMTTWDARIRDTDGGFIAGGTLITGAPRPSRELFDDQSWSPLTPPASPSWEMVPVAPTPPPFPTFTQHCEYRPISGAPLQGGYAETLGWVNYRTPIEWSEAALIALADAWYTVTLVPLTQLLPVGTINFSANLLIDPATLTPGEPLLHHGLVTGSMDGYASEQRRLWTRDGRLAVDNLQSVAVG
jgi:hypothetical protein